ncbi:MAG: DUF1844 domain-containing protein [Candidatus Abyssobacteria bacterium SURF_17]|uniref:DUF1844 domain-containing protein n=1 Tax=Candidatus Abyssobacteria bacterium SURF_17 TaxID=2093361 RepID=A0A419EV87_9BACT|nr:MAG: DUF1844 domain-containing protein [Candidatus Abyssubacteria bacterium SURF_17]
MAGPEKKVDESWKEEISREKERTQQEQTKDASTRARATQTGFPPMQASFATLITELAMQASLFMGDIPDPETNQPIEDLNRAKYLIDELGVLEQKTAGNLTPDEERALKNILFELRMRYVKKGPKP